MPHAPIVPFFRSYLRDLSESLFVRSAIDSAKCDRIREFTRKAECACTLATQGKPNVYIEAGIAYAVDTPFVLFDYVSPDAGGPGASLPSDLAHAMSLRYSSYQQLFREFYVALPVFAARNF